MRDITVKSALTTWVQRGKVTVVVKLWPRGFRVQDAPLTRQLFPGYYSKRCRARVLEFSARRRLSNESIQPAVQLQRRPAQWSASGKRFRIQPSIISTARG